MLKPSYYTYKTPLGLITIGTNGDAVTRIAYGRVKLCGEEKPTRLSNTASTQLLQFLAGKRFEFDFPIHAEGTDFQKAVWNELSKIPYGETRSYADIAAAVGNPKATRAVGMANNKNPLPIVVPCHRVIGANGKPVGYAGGLRIKEFLLELEKTYKA